MIKSEQIGGFFVQLKHKCDDGQEKEIVRESSIVGSGAPGASFLRLASEHLLDLQEVAQLVRFLNQWLVFGSLQPPASINSKQTERQLAILALNANWTVSRIPLYDEEGVEGWNWQSPGNDREYHAIGDWSEFPPFPDDAEAMATLRQNLQVAARKTIREAMRASGTQVNEEQVESLAVSLFNAAGVLVSFVKE